jgi:hypothetical protein
VSSAILCRAISVPSVPAAGTAPATFYVRVSKARGDGRPDFIYTLNI